MATPVEQGTFGGVDSRSNPLNLPRERALRCRNFVPEQSGALSLRWGYSTVSMSSVTATAVHSLLPYSLWDGTKYVVIGQGTHLRVLAISTGTVTEPTVRGAVIGSSGAWASYNSNNRLHAGNGTDQKWFDGTTWRNNGIRALVAADVSAVIISEGVRELTTTENSTITLTAAAGGSFAATTGSGFLFYVALFDTTTNERGPATVSAKSGARVTVTLNQKVTVANLLVPTNANWVKLIAMTADGGTNAYFCTNTATVITDTVRASGTLTAHSVAHGLSANDVVLLTSTTGYDGMYLVTNVPDADHFQVTVLTTTPASSTGGTVQRVVKAANGTTTVDVLSATTTTGTLANEVRGLAASSVGGANPGFQFYASIYNVNGGGAVGNRIAIGGRFLQTGYRTNVKLSGLPNLSGEDSEWVLLIGRTGDGAQLPYVVTDNSANWTYAASAATTLTITQGNIGGTFELPTRNGVIPSTCDKFARVGDRIYAATSVDPYIRRSATEADDRSGDFVGRPEQSWAPDDIETFPTAETPTCIFETDGELLAFSQENGAVLSDLAGPLLWRGPWNVGCAGRFAICRAPYGTFWVTGDKQLASIVNGEPVPVSEEYEVGLLANIGDAYLSNVRCLYYRDATKGIDRIIIKCQDSNGAPFEVYHDFKIRDGQSSTGQGYDAAYLGPLASDYTLAQVRDVNGKMQIWAGATNGRLFQEFSGSNDAGAEFTGDYISILNAGAIRPDVPSIDWYGDQNLIISIGQVLKTSLAASAESGFESLIPVSGAEAVQGEEDDFHFRCDLTIPEVHHPYIRLQLTSHSADGSLALNSPPHVPLENYGRIWWISALVSGVRGA